MESFATMVFGLGFFLFVIWLVVKSERESYDRNLNERREFGYQTVTEGNNLQKGSKKKK